MKKLVFSMVIAAGLYACGGTNNETTETKPISNSTKEETAPSTSTTPAAETKAETETKKEETVAKKDGKALIEASDCRTCHQNDTKVIGPAYKDVAKKYKADASTIKMLAGKIIKGGQGVWGEIPMSPHPNVSEDDAAAMVEYILSLK